MSSRRKLPRNSSRMKLGCFHSACREASATFSDSRSLVSGTLAVAMTGPPLMNHRSFIIYRTSPPPRNRWLWATRTEWPGPGSAPDQLPEPRLLPQGGEFRLDPRAGDGEAAPHADGPAEAAQGLLRLAAQGVDPGRV